MQRGYPSFLLAGLALLACLIGALPPMASSLAQDATGLLQPEAAAPEQEATEASAAPVRIRPDSADEEIAQRLQDILETTGHFEQPRVRVESGVAFLEGSTEDEEYRLWAGNLARNTQDVTAVVNDIKVAVPFDWDFAPAMAGLHELWQGFLSALPYFAFGLIILLLAWLLSRVADRFARRLMARRGVTPLIMDVIARGIRLLILLLGLFVVFHVAGLTAIAFTIMGGTGLLGIILGIAFRDITENLLASIFLSVQNPFSTGDLVEIEGITGFVERLTIRATILMSLDGNHIQIPNSTVYKSTIRNFTSNPNRREVFTVGIGFDDTVSEAQRVALEVLSSHPAVLKNPEPWVLVNDLGKATVNLRIYFWLDGSTHSWLKVRSSVIRLVKRAFQANSISMPDEEREVVFPQGVPVRLIREEGATQHQPEPRSEASDEAGDASTDAEAGLDSEASAIKEQARKSRTPEEGRNLLKTPTLAPGVGN